MTEKETDLLLRVPNKYTMEKQGLKLVGYLQTLDKPMVSLYLNTVENKLIVRLSLLSQPVTEAVVTVEAVRGYINGSFGLKRLTGLQSMAHDSMFVEELCNERSRIEYFLNHFNQYIHTI